MYWQALLANLDQQTRLIMIGNDHVEVLEVTPSSLEAYQRIPMRHIVTSVFDVTELEGGSFVLTKRPIEPAYAKDYDDLADQRPTAWPSRFDVSNWGFFLARKSNSIVGAAAVAFDTPTVDMLEGRSYLAVLWDIRVDPEAQRTGVGAALIKAVEVWARQRNCREMKIETQNNNVPACRFYHSQGYSLHKAIPDAYSDFPNEVQLLWYKKL